MNWRRAIRAMWLWAVIWMSTEPSLDQWRHEWSTTSRSIASRRFFRRTRDTSQNGTLVGLRRCRDLLRETNQSLNRLRFSTRRVSHPALIVHEPSSDGLPALVQGEHAVALGEDGGDVEVRGREAPCIERPRRIHQIGLGMRQLFQRRGFLPGLFFCLSRISYARGRKAVDDVSIG